MRMITNGTPAIQAFDQRHPVIVGPTEIRRDDWMEDRGTLRQVDYVDLFGGGSGVLLLVHFKHQKGVPSLVLGIQEGTENLAVWRTLPEPGGEPC